MVTLAFGVVSMSMFSCELGGPGASLEATGVASLLVDRAFGRKLALVVSLRWDVGVETFGGAGDDAAGPPGDDFWKKDMMDFCFVAEEAGAAFGDGFAGVCAAMMSRVTSNVK